MRGSLKHYRPKSVCPGPPIIRIGFILPILAEPVASLILDFADLLHFGNGCFSGHWAFNYQLNNAIHFQVIKICGLESMQSL